MDDETAEIELLEQNLNKTRQISQRMTSILSSFDTRLVKLEKSILPLYNSSQILTRRSKNIESALNKIDEIHAYQEGIAAEEALVLRGPQPGQLQDYIEVVTRMNQTIAFGSVEMGAVETARLVETGAKKLIQLYTKLVAEASSGTPINGPDFEPMPFPPDILETLHSLVDFLRTLPLPPTHPTHPAAPAIQAALKEAQKGYGDMRGAWGKKCLEVYGKRVAERAGTVDGVVTGREFATFMDNILNVADSEYALLLTLAPLTSPTSINSTYTTLLNPLCTLFSSTVSSLSSLIKRDLSKYTPMALSLFSYMSAEQERWDQTMVRRTGRRENELKDGMQSMKATCQRSFPEFLADIKLAANSSRGELSTGVIDTTISTVEYIERLPEVREAACAMLLSLGDGNWKMGEGARVAKSARQDVDEKTILEHFTFDIVNTTLSTLQTLADSNRRPAFGSIFLLNNVAYLVTQLLTRPSSPAIRVMLSKPSQDVLRSNFRTAKAAYFDSNFSPMLQTLTDDGNKSKSAIKEKFTRFFDLFDETTERHQLARVLHDDDGARMQVSEEAVKLVVPSLQKFIQKNLGKEFSKNPKKYIKMSAEEVEALIKSFYLERDGPPPAERETNNLLIQAGWSR
ncbi:Cullin repeat-like-containing domain protein [Fomitopsis betulina]|nr:Cullin repeat-like-containing domain protein [Fomitopsis betulina]